MSKIKRGISLYSYQQTQFFKILDVWQQIQEVRENLKTDGIEIISETTIKGYPFPSNVWVDKWHKTIEKYNMNTVTYDAHVDVLQFRDHLMDYDECADRLKRDLRIAKRLGFKIVRTHSSHKMDVMLKALRVAEEVDIPMAIEIHAPMSLYGPEATEVIEYVQKTGTKHLGIYPDFGIFQVRIQKPVEDWYLRQGCSPEVIALAQKICDENLINQIDPNLHQFNTASFYHELINNGSISKDAPPILVKGLQKYVNFIKAALENKIKPVEWDLFSWPFKMHICTGKELIELAPYINGFHGKFYDMTEIPGQPGKYEDISIDYKTPIESLKKAGWEGYICSENEGQRHYQDLSFEFYQDEIEQARRHHKMLARLIEAG